MKVTFSSRNKLYILTIFLIVCAILFSLRLKSRSRGVDYDPPEISARVEMLRLDCGELCETVALGEPGPYFNHINVPIDCQKIFRNEYIDSGHNLEHAPKSIPKSLIPDFTMNGRLPVSSWYFDQHYLGQEAMVSLWTENMINKYIDLAKEGQLKGNYGVEETNALRDGLKNAPGIKDGRVLVIGSEDPWVEACVLEAGAREVVTLEYGKITSEHPKVKTMVPLEFRKAFASNTLGKFSAIVTFSSVEHSGLGRYGDALNPWGDILTIARAWCVAEDDASLTVGVMYDNENDYIKFNAGRWYGRTRYPYLATNWRQHYRGSGEQRVHVFTKDKVKTNKHVSYYLQKPFPDHPVTNIDKRYSQVNQDLLVHKLFPKRGGFFLEMGAYDGQRFSNTLWLERRHNWSGLLIEASPDLCRKIDSLQRHVWRLCACISNDVNQTKFIQSDTVGGMENKLDIDHMRLIKETRTVTVPCFSMETVLNTINVHHIDYFSLDVEGAEMFILNSLKKLLQSKKLTVDIWTIEYRVYDGKQNILDKSKVRLSQIRQYFNELGQYVEHSQINDEDSDEDGVALDVVYVSINSWCKTHNMLPNGKKCAE